MLIVTSILSLFFVLFYGTCERLVVGDAGLVRIVDLERYTSIIAEIFDTTHSMYRLPGIPSNILVEGTCASYFRTVQLELHPSMTTPIR